MASAALGRAKPKPSGQTFVRGSRGIVKRTNGHLGMYQSGDPMQPTYFRAPLLQRVGALFGGPKSDIGRQGRAIGSLDNGFNALLWISPIVFPHVGSHLLLF